MLTLDVRTNGRRLLLLLMVPILFLAQGCAFGTRSVALMYDQIDEELTAPPQTIALVVFSDDRESPEYGEVRNGFGIKTASIAAEGQDAGAWVANALAVELLRGGMDVRKFSDAAPPDINVVITGSVMEAYVKMLLTYRTVIRVQVAIEKSGLSVLNKEYTGNAKSLALTASTGAYEAQLKSALRDVMTQLVPDVFAALRSE